jgi:hypothetical protein
MVLVDKFLVEILAQVVREVQLYLLIIVLHILQEVEVGAVQAQTEMVAVVLVV